MFSEYGISERLCELDKELMKRCAPFFAAIDETAGINQLKVLTAFTRNKVGAQHLIGSTGYGYGDIARDTLDRVFADAVGAEDALCRAQFMSGTHALTVALFGMLRTGDTLLAATGKPYDTLSSVIGKEGEAHGSLKDFGINYDEVPLVEGRANLKEIEKRAKKARLVHIQRSRGYSDRRALSVSEIGEIVTAVKRGNPNATVMVDNCYGEFTETSEPLSVGADLIVGSLIKNPGGAIAETGGYIAGRADCVEKCAHRLSAPGTGREIGSFPSGLRQLYLGLYLSPMITAEALKTSVYASALFEELGYSVSPRFDEKRSDIITTIELKNALNLTKFCGAIQAASPVDSFAAPEAWEMPGYDDKVIMAAGAFTCGSSIELSCDAPMREPFRVYLQGGINLAASRYALLSAAERMS